MSRMNSGHGRPGAYPDVHVHVEMREPGRGGPICPPYLIGRGMPRPYGRRLKSALPRSLRGWSAGLSLRVRGDARGRGGPRAYPAADCPRNPAGRASALPRSVRRWSAGLSLRVRGDARGRGMPRPYGRRLASALQRGLRGWSAVASPGGDAVGSRAVEPAPQHCAAPSEDATPRPGVCNGARAGRQSSAGAAANSIAIIPSATNSRVLAKMPSASSPHLVRS